MTALARSAAALLMPTRAQEAADSGAADRRREVKAWLGVPWTAADDDALEAALKASHQAHGGTAQPWPAARGALQHPLDDAELVGPGEDDAMLLPLRDDLTSAGLDALWARLARGSALRRRPADPRVRDYSVWGQRAFACALLGAAGGGPLTDAYLLSVHVGPPEGAQAFIAQSRRTSELWARSYMLTVATARAMARVIAVVGRRGILRPLALPGACAPLDALIDPARLADMSLAARARSSLPNRFLAVVPRSALDALQESIPKAVSACMEDAQESVWAWLDDLVSPPDATDHALLRSSLRCQITGIPWPAATSDVEAWSTALGLPGPDRGSRGEDGGVGATYPTLIDALERWSVALRQSRSPEPRAGTDGWAKCTSCGVRPQLFDGRREAWLEFSQRLASADSGRQALWVPHGDALCITCFTLRMSPVAFFGNPAVSGLAWDRRWTDRAFLRFPSTPSIASAPARAALARAAALDGGLGEAVTQWLARLENLQDENAAAFEAPGANIPHAPDHPLMRQEGAWFSEDAYDVERIRRDFDLDDGDHERLEAVHEHAPPARAAWREVLRRLGNLSAQVRADAGLPTGQPWRASSYYAVIALDGDEIGKWLGARHDHSPTWAQRLGISSAKGRRPLYPSLQMDISERQSWLSREGLASAIESESTLGRVVYAGGDDMLALVPVRSAVSAAERSRAMVSSIERGLGRKVTASAGVAIAHSRMPIADALGAARSALAQSKAQGRDRLHVVLSPRSGGEIGVTLPWRDEQAGWLPWSTILRPLVQEYIADAEAGTVGVSARALLILERERWSLDKLWRRGLLEEAAYREVLGRLLGPSTVPLIGWLEAARWHGREEDRDTGAIGPPRRRAGPDDGGETSLAGALIAVGLLARFLARESRGLELPERTPRGDA
jgi:CRISPR-associated protein Cmr2